MAPRAFLRSSPTVLRLRTVRSLANQAPGTSKADNSGPKSMADHKSSKYILAMFPYPSGRLHMGHLRVYTLSDVLARFYTLRGHPRVIHPIGWDAFGLPAENAARERGADAAQWTERNIEEMRTQLAKTGVQFDWSREIFTCRPDYFRWTQWIFLQLYKHGLVRKAYSEVNWDPVDGTVLADEQVDANGCSWRSGAVVEKRLLRQWAVDTPRYAKQLLDGLGPLEFEWRGVAGIQADWIGPCDVYRFLLPIQPSAGEQLDLRVTDPTELCRAQFVVLGAEHPIAKEAAKDAKFEEGQAFAILDHLSVPNLATGRPMPVVAMKMSKMPMENDDKFVLNARLGHAQSGDPIDRAISERLGLLGKMENDVPKMSADEVIGVAESQNVGGYLTSRVLRDWVVSRQRAWGTPIPMLLEEGGAGMGVEPVAEELLPVLGTQRGERMPAKSFPSGWGRLETDTLDTYFDSSWYFLRFLDPHNERAPFDPQIVAKDMPVDVYVGGMEHAKMHLFYARFMCHFLHHALGMLPREAAEPFARFIPLGVVKAPTYRVQGSGKYVPDGEVDGDKRLPNPKLVHKPSGQPVRREFEKMSKSKHNGVDPLVVIGQFGADLTRLQLLFEARPSQPINWPYPFPTHQVKSLRRWINRLQTLVDTFVEAQKGRDVNVRPEIDAELEPKCAEAYNNYVKKVTMYLEVLLFHNMGLVRLQDFTKTLARLQHEQQAGPKATAESPGFARCVHAMVVMLQLFAPEMAARHWAALQSVPFETINSDPRNWLPDPGAPVMAQKWPVPDPDPNVDFLLLVFDTIFTANVPREELAALLADDAKLEQYAREHCHRRFFQLLEENGVSVLRSNIRHFPGLCTALSLEMPTNVRKRTITWIIETLNKERRKEQEEEEEEREERDD